MPKNTNISTIIPTNITLKFSALRVEVDSEGTELPELIQGKVGVLGLNCTRMVSVVESRRLSDNG